MFAHGSSLYRGGLLVPLRLTLAALLSGCLTPCFALEAPAGTVTDTLAVAVRAFENYDVGESSRRYEVVVASTEASNEQRVIAHRALANYDWKFKRDRSAAVLHLDQAIRNGETPSRCARRSR